MKRKYLGDENDGLTNGDNGSRKKARSQPVDIDEYEFENTQDITPSKPQSARRKLNGTPKESVNYPLLEDEVVAEQQPTSEPATPIKRGRGRPKGSKNLSKPEGSTPTPKKTPKGKILFSTPIKPLGAFRDALHGNDTPSKIRNAADRSARRKSTRALIERTMNGDASSDEEDEEIARHIYDSDKEEDGQGEDGTLQAPDGHEEGTAVPETPSKRARGRPKGSKNKIRSPSPPRDLPPHELYFAQNRGASMKTSNNNLSSLALLDHGEYFSLLRSYEDPHAKDLEFLQKIHARSFPQWDFELSQAFNICLYGWGSKRSLLTSYATHISSHSATAKIIIINGYNPSTTMRDILSTITSLLPHPPKKPGVQPAEILDRLLAHLSTSPSLRLTLLIHSLDAAPLRRPATQALIARLAAHPQISLVASADHPAFPLLWDSSARTAFNFVFHDCTTFAPYVAEVDVVEGVHQLLGRSGRRVGGKEGVGFVLRSLPVNARSLFRILVVEMLVVMDEEGGGGEEEEGEEEGGRGRGRTGEVGVEYRTLYQKAVEDFVCGDEVAFRSLLKEFHDHQMITSRKDALGTEILSIPFRREELEAILEDLMS